ncbi:mammalian cell entry protein [Mycobacterium sp. CBMA 234]|uniref:mammalian cell entry protein n=1 Tax=Mycolicibacterium sp. CBMA 234 TaxID=1918495 RepID=UPI0012DF0BAC|nr:mammalian cell entry protein [Mycolicibacterium sp. CBMA 234]MUL67400.1 mammalian cell entry protein [Mycolicibacterium sp. CBMA 234]
MSPRRKVDSAERFFAGDYFKAVTVAPRSWALAVIAGVATLLVVGAIAASTYLMVRHERDVESQAKSAAVLGYVQEFMKGFTAVDPFHANAYVDRITGQATGEFGKQFKDKRDQILLQVARAQPAEGAVEAVGVQRWNDDGSADVLIAMKLTTTTPDGKATVENGSRWVVTATQEGQQWKISRMNPVM